jgi:uncharacterized membrane protein
LIWRQFGVALVTLIVLDGIWLGVLMSSFYRRSLGSLARVGESGALFGALTFAVYDLTNHATLRGWSPAMTCVDIAWGACSCAIASYIAKWGW